MEQVRVINQQARGYKAEKVRRSTVGCQDDGGFCLCVADSRAPFQNRHFMQSADFEFLSSLGNVNYGYPVNSQPIRYDDYDYSGNLQLTPYDNY